jgi:hypothetical protein
MTIDFEQQDYTEVGAALVDGFLNNEINAAHYGINRGFNEESGN